MPGMDGIALAKAIRQPPGSRPLALILLSSIGQTLPVAHGDAAFAGTDRAHGLRRSRTDFARSSAGARARRRPPGPSPDQPAPASLRVLVAEDNPANQQVALRLLERLGHHADLAASGREALDRLSQSASA